MATKSQLKFFAYLSSLSKEEGFCDVSLKLSDGQRKCNRLVLAAVSQFFNGMLSTDILEGQSGLVKLPTVSTATFDTILNFYVHGKCEPKHDHIINISPGTIHLKDLFQLYISTDTSLKIWQHTRTFKDEYLVISKAFEVLIENFELVSKQEDFLRLPFCDVMTILKYSGLNRPLDDHILEAILRWIESNEPTEDAAQDLVDNLRLEYVTPGCIVKNVDRVKLVEKYGGIVEVMKKELAGEPIPATEEVIVHCSSSAGLMQVYAYDPIGTKWYCLSQDIEINLKDFAATFADSKIIVSGGYSQTRSLSDTYIFNTLTNLWYRGPSMNKARHRHSSVSINNVAYVLGGYSGEELSDIVEELPPTQEKWRFAGTLCTATSNAAVITLGNYILIFGGVEGSNKTIQCFSVDTKTSCILHTVGKSTMLVKNTILARYCYLLLNSSFSVLYRNDKEKPLLKVYKKALDIEEFDTKEFDTSDSCGVVAFNENIIVFTKKYSKEIRIDGKKHTIHTLPNMPISISEVFSAFRARVPVKCLQSE